VTTKFSFVFHVWKNEFVHLRNMNEFVSLRNINDFVVSQKTRERELHHKNSVVVITRLISEV
jgi:hypothetical protein